MNPGSRLLALMKASTTGLVPQNETARKRWLTVLKQPGDSEKLTDHLISRRLLKAIDQVDVLERLLIDLNVDSALFHNDLVKVRNSLSPSRLGDQWSTVATGFSSEVLKSLGWQAWVVGSKEETIDEAVLQDLRSKISGLIRSLNEGSGIPSGIAEQIKSQLEALGTSLNDYSITGIDPISKDLKHCIVDVVENSEELKEVMSSGNKNAKNIMHGFSDVLLKTNTAVQSTGKTAAAVNSLMNVGKEVFKLLTGS